MKKCEALLAQGRHFNKDCSLQGKFLYNGKIYCGIHFKKIKGVRNSAMEALLNKVCNDLRALEGVDPNETFMPVTITRGELQQYLELARDRLRELLI